MKKLLLFACLIALLAASYSQTYIQEFEGWSSPELVFEINQNQPGNLWQIGRPQKVLFTSAYSIPNAIVTDTLSVYPESNTSSFTLKITTWQLTWYPNYVLGFKHKWDTDSLDGGFIEFSYDGGLNWRNIFRGMDTIPYVYQYGFAHDFVPDTLINGEVGFSGQPDFYDPGSSPWIETMICWPTYQIPSLGDSLYIRFSFVSDEVPSLRDGWMIDNFFSFAAVTHPVDEFLKMRDFIVARPNPVEDHFFIQYDVPAAGAEVDICLIDPMGRVVYTLAKEWQEAGVHEYAPGSSDFVHPDGLLYLRARVGERSQVQPMLFLRGNK